MTRREAEALALFGALTVITVGWWALAFWPTGGPGGELLQRTRDVCFGTRASGLPDGAGWMALIIQPTLMFGLFFVIMGQAFEEAIGRVVRQPVGRVVLGSYVVVLFLGLSAVGVRLANASNLRDAAAVPVESETPGTYPRLDRPAPEFVLVDQRGRQVGMEAFRGRPVIVTFAFGHCETVCPVVVHDARAAIRRTEPQPALMVITLDPWRDVPSRLGYIAEQWQLAEGEVALSGSVAEVEAVLDAWAVPRARDPQTGDIVHPRLVFLVDAEGAVAYAVTGGADQMVELLGRL